MADILKIAAGVAIAQAARPIILTAIVLVRNRVEYGQWTTGCGFWKEFRNSVMGLY